MDRQGVIIICIVATAFFLDIFFPLHYSPFHIARVGKYRVSYFADTTLHFEPKFQNIVTHENAFVTEIQWVDTVHGVVIFKRWRWYDRILEYLTD